MRHVWFVLVGAGITLAAGPLPLSAGELHVAFWNVENLFDTEDDPTVEGDEEFTPTGPKQWTKERLDNKLLNLSRAIMDMNGRKGPDVLGLAEVENRWVVEELVKALKPLDRDYRIVHKDSPSSRGIDCALIYDAKVFTLVNARFHFVKAGNTRDIVEAELQDVGKRRLTVFVNHWPSRRSENGKPNDELRRIAGDTLRRRIDEILKQDPDADLVALGDFNDNPDDPSVRKHLGSSPDAKTLQPRELFNTSATLQKDDAGNPQGTLVFMNKWDLFDQVIVSSGLLDQKGFTWKSSEIFKPPYLIFTPKKPGDIPRPNRSYSGNLYHKTGYSDHLPVGCVIRY